MRSLRLVPTPAAWAAILSAFLLGTPASAAAPPEPSARFEATLPVEIDFDFGADNGNAVINRYLPLAAIPVGDRWRVLSLTQFMLARAPGGVPGRPGNPEPGSGDRVFGVGDLTQLALVQPPPVGRFLWGAGAVVIAPIASDVRLGSGKWSVGPAVRVVYRPGQWNVGGIAANYRSVAGDADRADVHQLLVRAFIRRKLGGGWFLTSNPIITANWNAPPGQTWLVPLGAGIGKRFDTGWGAWAMAAHGYVNAVRPDGAPHSLIRLDFLLPIPRSLGG